MKKKNSRALARARIQINCLDSLVWIIPNEQHKLKRKQIIESYIKGIHTQTSTRSIVPIWILRTHARENALTHAQNDSVEKIVVVGRPFGISYILCFTLFFSISFSWYFKPKKKIEIRKKWKRKYTNTHNSKIIITIIKHTPRDVEIMCVCVYLYIIIHF